VLVDGGQGYGGLTDMLLSRGLTAIDVVVCTHNDSDHANGIAGLMDSAVSVGEVWLPARWQGILRETLGDPGGAGDLLARRALDHVESKSLGRPCPAADRGVVAGKLQRDMVRHGRKAQRGGTQGLWRPRITRIELA
jgi:hypothetical protein